MKKSIGIIGGMGPLATADLFRKIVEFTVAKNDNEHIHIYIDDNTHIPDRTEAILNNGADPYPMMIDSIRKLEACGADCIIMPCNTAHFYLPRLQYETRIPFLNMLSITAKVCAERYPNCTAGVLATKGTLLTGLYSEALKAEGVPYILPDEQARNLLMSVIYDEIKGGRPLEETREKMEMVFSGMAASGADYYILGCTELPIVAEGLHLDKIFINPTTELAKAAIRFCGYQVKG